MRITTCIALIVIAVALVLGLGLLAQMEITGSAKLGIIMVVTFFATTADVALARRKKYTWPFSVVYVCMGLTLGLTISLGDSFLRMPNREIVWGVAGLLLIRVWIYSERHFRR
jgi:hypothetical protein